MKFISFTLFFLVLLTTPALAGTDLEGTVMDAEGNPIAEATVYVYTAAPKEGLSTLCPYCYLDCQKSATTDPNGRFLLYGLDDSLLFNLLAVADGYESTFAKGIDATSGAAQISLPLRHEDDPALVVRGKVVDPKGAPVVGATVTPNGLRVGKRVGYGNIPGLERLSVTNRKGEFVLRIPAEAKLDVRVSARALAPTIARELSPGTAATIALEEGVAAEGRLTRNGEPVTDVSVQFGQQNRASKDFLGLVEVATDERGNFLMLNLPPDEEYFVTPILRGAGTARAARISTGASGTRVSVPEIVVERGREIRGRLVVPEGVVLPDPTRVLLLGGISGEALEAIVDQEGRFRFAAASYDETRLIVRIPGLEVSPETAGHSRSGVVIEEGKEPVVRDVVMQVAPKDQAGGQRGR